MFHPGKEGDSDPSEQPRSMEEVELKLLRQNRRYNWTLIIVMGFLGVCLVVLAVVDINNSEKVQRGLSQGGQTLEILKQQTSPERQAQNNERLSQIILQVDCNNRDAIEDVIRGLKEEGLLTGDITVITPECKELIDE